MKKYLKLWSGDQFSYEAGSLGCVHILNVNIITQNNNIYILHYVLGLVGVSKFDTLSMTYELVVLLGVAYILDMGILVYLMSNCNRKITILLLYET